MKESGIWVRSIKKYKVTTNSVHEQPVSENILKCEFDVAQQTIPTLVILRIYGHNKVVIS